MSKNENHNITDELTAVLEELVEEIPDAEQKKREGYTIINNSEFLLGDRHYQLVADYREGFQLEKFVERFSDVLARYDYVVGDWGHDQLRLKGFFAASNKRVLPDQRIDTLQDYLYEFCNFGCAYFVVQRLDVKREKQNKYKNKNQKSRHHKKNTQQASTHIEQKTKPVHKSQTKTKIKNRKSVQAASSTTSKKETSNSKNKGFTIRQREET